MLAAMVDFINGSERIFLLTGAGVSTGSGIPDYRDSDGEWKHKKPVDFRDFIDKPSTRKRYWARSTLGWQWFSKAQPNDAHKAIARLEQCDKWSITVTQNVDGLHQRAGSQSVIDLHGRNDRVTCMACDAKLDRESFQTELIACNPQLADIVAAPAPDGDAVLEDFDFSRVSIPECHLCGGMQKPDVVFFGETVPVERIQAALDALNNSDAMLVVGSSLMVYSGYRFALKAKDAGIPVAAINLGKTRADDVLFDKFNIDCVSALRGFLG